MTRRHRRKKFHAAPSAKGSPQSWTKSARLVDQLVARHAEALIQRAIDLAMAGNERSLLFCLDRVVPARRPIGFKLPPIMNVHDASEALAMVITAVNVGDLTAAEAAQLAHLLQGYAKVIKINDLVARLEAVEAELGTKKA